MSQNYLKIDFDYIPAKVMVYQKGVLVKKWTAKKPESLIHQVIDGLDDTGMNKLKIKKTLEICLNVFSAKSISIVEKDTDEKDR